VGRRGDDDRERGGRVPERREDSEQRFAIEPLHVVEHEHERLLVAHGRHDLAESPGELRGSGFGAKGRERGW